MPLLRDRQNGRGLGLGAAVDYARGPWTHAAGATLDDFLARPQDELRRALASCVED